MVKKYLYLDDERMPYQTGNYMYPVELRPMYRKEEWWIVRNYDEFVIYIETQGVPDVVSFDHDLAEIHYNPKTWVQGFKYHEKTGYDCARFLCEYCIDNEIPLPEWYVHSQNPVGAENIKSYMKSAEKYIESTKNRLSN